MQPSFRGKALGRTKNTYVGITAAASCFLNLFLQTQSLFSSHFSFQCWQRVCGHVHGHTRPFSLSGALPLCLCYLLELMCYRAISRGATWRRSGEVIVVPLSLFIAIHPQKSANRVTVRDSLLFTRKPKECLKGAAVSHVSKNTHIYNSKQKKKKRSRVWCGDGSTALSKCLFSPVGRQQPQFPFFFS